MGATLVAQALQHWSHVSDRAFRVLVAMALTARDKPTPDVPASLYFGGHDGLIYALHFKPDTKRDSQLRSIRLAVDELEAVGAVICTREAYSGGHAVYKLTLNTIPIPRKPKPRKSTHFAVQADTGNPPEADTVIPPQADTAHPAQADTGNPPYKEPLEEPLEELKEEEVVALTTDLTVTRARSGIDTPESDPSPCQDPTCVMGYLYDRTQPPGRRNIPCPTCLPQAKILPFRSRRAP